MEKLETLRQYYGYSAFRPGQEPLIDARLAGRDTLGVMPTGAASRSAIRFPRCCRASRSSCRRSSP